MSNQALALQFFVQLAIILAAVRVVGYAARWVGQPQVVGEMIAGVLLGPSLFGLLAPDVFAWAFPKGSTGVLYVMSQVGVALYMFLVGVEFDLETVKKRAGSAATVSIAGIAVPFALGAALAVSLPSREQYFAPSASSFMVGLFLGSALSITAFPMLARIIYERGLAGSEVGTLALAAGASDDAVAWVNLAFVLSLFGGDKSLIFKAIGGGLVYLVIVFVVGRRLLARLDRHVEKRGRMEGSVLGVVVMLLGLGCAVMDFAGLHAVFGAFILGLAMPKGPLAEELQRVLEPVATNVFVPMFFVFSGLNTKLSLALSPALLLPTLAMVLIACVGKLFACYGAARLHGTPHREAMAVGALMNARGLMELILLNIGLERGFITPTLFTMMVIMAIATTFMATPLFEWVYGRRAPRAVPDDAVPSGLGG